METLTIPTPRGFRLQAAADFYASFTPGSGMAAAAVDARALTLAFRLDDTFEAVAAMLLAHGEGITVDVAGTRDLPRVRRQLHRMLGLDVDGEAWLAVGRRDRVVGALQAEFPGFFTAAKASPYDAATWGVIAPRMGIEAAARIKIALAHSHGNAVTLHGRTHHVFPSPDVLACIEQVPGLAEEKVVRLRGIGRAAQKGLLGADRLRALGEARALADLMTLRGIGPWGASHIYYRGVAPADGLPTAEPRVLHGVAAAYGIDLPSLERFEQMAEAWRPFRMWVCVLLSRHLARHGAWHASGLSRERAAAGKTLTRGVAHAVARQCVSAPAGVTTNESMTIGGDPI